MHEHNILNDQRDPECAACRYHEDLERIERGLNERDSVSERQSQALKLIASDTEAAGVLLMVTWSSDSSAEERHERIKQHVEHARITALFLTYPEALSEEQRQYVESRLGTEGGG
jgi:hypothetical protein